MARAGQFSPVQGTRSADHFGIYALTWALPSTLVDEAVEAAGRTEKRSRALPSRTVVYFTLAMWLYPSSGYGEVMRLVSAGLTHKHRWARPWPAPSTAAIAKARQRLGSRPLRLLFERVAKPAGLLGTVGAFYRGWRLLSVDLTMLDVQDSPDNRTEYGGPGRGTAPERPPRVKVAAVAESGTQSICSAALGAPELSNAALARQAFAALRPGQLVMADQSILSWELWTRARESGADLLWRAEPALDLPVLDVLNDGSYLSRLAAPAGAGPTHPVRVIEFALGGPYRSHPHSPAETVRLVCSVLEPEQAPGEDLAWAHSRRWRFDSVLDQLGARQGQAGPVLRSKSPAMVEQEVWAMLLAHHAIRRLVVAGDEESAADRAAFHRAFRPIERRSAK